MVDKPKHLKVESRNENFSEKILTRITKEECDAKNPFLAQKVFHHGYDVLDLISNCSYSEVFFLLFRGELPKEREKILLEKLMIALINLGPRHPATRAALAAAVGKTEVAHILPISLSMLGGEYRGGGRIEESMRFFRKNFRKSVQEFVENLKYQSNENQIWSDGIAGIGALYCDIDPHAKNIAEHLTNFSEEGSALRWGSALVEYTSENDHGWLIEGIAAAVFSDLGFQPKAGVALFQLLCAPGLVAHGMEYANKPITSLPFTSDKNYIINTIEKKFETYE